MGTIFLLGSQQTTQHELFAGNVPSRHQTFCFDFSRSFLQGSRSLTTPASNTGFWLFLVRHYRFLHVQSRFLFVSLAGHLFYNKYSATFIANVQETSYIYRMADACLHKGHPT